MPRHNVLAVLVLSLEFIVACRPSTLTDTADQGGAEGADAQGASAPLLFGPHGFSDALNSIPRLTTCSVMEEQWQVRAPGSGPGLNTLAFVASMTTIKAAYCSIKIDVPVVNKVDFTKYPTGLISFDTSYINSLGSMELRVDASGMTAVNYPGAKISTQTNRSFVGRFDTARIQNDKLSLTFEINFSSSVMASTDQWIVSNVSAYAAQ